MMFSTFFIYFEKKAREKEKERKEKKVTQNKIA